MSKLAWNFQADKWPQDGSKNLQLLRNAFYHGGSRSVWPDWAIYWTLGNFLKPLATVELSQSHTFLDNFCKYVKIYHFSSEIIFGQFLYTFGDFFSGHTDSRSLVWWSLEFRTLCIVSGKITSSDKSWNCSSRKIFSFLKSTKNCQKETSPAKMGLTEDILALRDEFKTDQGLEKLRSLIENEEPNKVTKVANFWSKLGAISFEYTGIFYLSSGRRVVTWTSGLYPDEFFATGPVGDICWPLKTSGSFSKFQIVLTEYFNTTRSHFKALYKPILCFTTGDRRSGLNPCDVVTRRKSSASNGFARCELWKTETRQIKNHSKNSGGIKNWSDVWFNKLHYFEN